MSVLFTFHTHIILIYTEYIHIYAIHLLLVELTMDMGWEVASFTTRMFS